MMTGSKPIEATEAEEKLAEAYAILRQVRHYLSQAAPLPRAQDDVRKIVRAFCEDFETKLRAKRGQPISPPRLAEGAAPDATPQTGDVLVASAGAAMSSPRQAPPSVPTMTAEEWLAEVGSNSVLLHYGPRSVMQPDDLVVAYGQGHRAAMRWSEWLRYRHLANPTSFPKP